MATLTPCSACGYEFNQGMGGIPKCPKCGTSSNQFVLTGLGWAFAVVVLFIIVIIVI